jgi:hypothetical protein
LRTNSTKDVRVNWAFVDRCHNLAASAIDRHNDLSFIAVLSANRGRHRRLNGLENQFRVNVLIAMKRVDNS